ncbi:sensor histidine kinase [Nonomuraea sediminis]|uniref:sensor histidine kinase n=1 Tax=Nonomuraea sediminis TaxID=2835864 RepID=UPI001BDC4304|nr:sensor histidine kinase [Nonomuraea sediminis]
MCAKVVSSLVRLAGVNPFLVDLTLGVVIAASTTVFEFTLSSSQGSAPDALCLALIGVTSLALAWRRRAPLIVLAVSCVGAIVFHTLGYEYQLNNFASLFALYTVAAHRLPQLSLLTTLPVAAVWWHTALLGPVDLVWPSIVQGSLVIAIAWAFGNSTRMLAERNRRLAHLAERLQQDQGDRARRAVTEERVHIARELHDIVAHHISVIAVQAGLARYVSLSDPATARTALATIADTSSEAMDEMRRLLAVLRIEADDEGDSYDPAPGLGRLGQLVERMRSAGVEVDVEVTGSPRSLSPGVDLCAYRVIQESLTNVLKHAGPAHARVALRYSVDELELRITDDGHGAAAVNEPDGHGLIGMRERVRLYRGTTIARARPQRGFEVVVTLPMSATASDDQSPTSQGETYA